MKKDEKLIRTIFVSNDKQIDVFRLHIFDDSIKFDPHMAYGISKNDLIYTLVNDIEIQWKEKKITIDELFKLFISILDTHECYLSQFYFKPEELNIYGQLLKLRQFSAYAEKEFIYFMSIKNKDNIHKIHKVEFEKNIDKKEIADSYVENFSPKNAEFYTYRLSGQYNHDKSCFLMTVKNNLKLGFVKTLPDLKQN
jgi:hypothetical protein